MYTGLQIIVHLSIASTTMEIGVLQGGLFFCCCLVMSDSSSLHSGFSWQRSWNAWPFPSPVYFTEEERVANRVKWLAKDDTISKWPRLRFELRKMSPALHPLAALFQGLKLHNMTRNTQIHMWSTWFLCFLWWWKVSLSWATSVHVLLTLNLVKAFFLIFSRHQDNSFV